MAAIEVMFPSGEYPGKIIKWRVRMNTMVAAGRVLLLYHDVIPRKEDVTVPEKKLRAVKFGRVIKLLVNDGDIVQPGQVIATLEGCKHPTVMKDLCAECGVDLRMEGSANDGKEVEVSQASVPMLHSVPELKVCPELAEKIGKEDEMRLLKDKKLALLVDLDQTIVHTTNDNIPPNMKDVYHYQLYGPNSPWYHTRLRPNTRHFLSEMSRLYELHICTFGARNYAHTVAALLDKDGILFSHRILSRDECFDPASKTANLKALFPCGDDLVCIIDDREDVWQGCGNLVQVKPYHFFRHTGDIHAPPGLEKSDFPSLDIPNTSDVVPKESEDKTEKNGTMEPTNDINENVNENKKETEKDSDGVTLVNRFEIDTKESLELDLNKTEESDVNTKPVEPMVDVEAIGPIQDTDKINSNENVNEDIVKDLVPSITEAKPDKDLEKRDSAVNKTDLNKIELDNSVIIAESETCISKVEFDNVKAMELPVNSTMDDLDNIVKTNTDGNIISNTDAKQEDGQKCVSVEPERKTTEVEILNTEPILDDEDDDDYLLYLEDILRRIHTEFYAHLDTKKEKTSLRDIIPKVRAQVLKGLYITFSGLIPTHQKLHQSRAYKVARAFGAQVTQDLTEKTTHLVAIKPGTAKANAAKKNGNIKIVNPDWLWTCAERWEHVDERLFPLTSKARASRVPPPHCSSPERREEEEAKEEETKRFADSINPLMSFTPEELEIMDKEVDEDMEEQEMEILNFDAEDADETGKRSRSSDSEDSANDCMYTFLKRKKLSADSSDDDGNDGNNRDDDEDDDDDDDDDDDPVTRFRRGENLPDDLDLGDNSQDSVDELDRADDEDDREWNAMGAALEREFLSD